MWTGATLSPADCLAQLADSDAWTTALGNSILAKELADTLGLRFMETSAKDSYGVQEAFQTIAEAIWLRMKSARADCMAFW